MRVLIVIAALLGSISAGAAEAPPGPETSAPGSETTAPSVPNEPDEAIVAAPTNLKEAVNRTLEVFVPSEEIDVDKPVDFPTNI